MVFPVSVLQRRAGRLHSSRGAVSHLLTIISSVVVIIITTVVRVITTVFIITTVVRVIPLRAWERERWKAVAKFGSRRNRRSREKGEAAPPHQEWNIGSR